MKARATVEIAKAYAGMASRTTAAGRPPTPASSSTNVKKNTPKSATGMPQKLPY